MINAVYNATVVTRLAGIHAATLNYNLLTLTVLRRKMSMPNTTPKVSILIAHMYFAFGICLILIFLCNILIRMGISKSCLYLLVAFSWTSINGMVFLLFYWMLMALYLSISMLRAVLTASLFSLMFLVAPLIFISEQLTDD